MNNLQKNNKSIYATRIIAAVIGIILATSGIYPHGFYEALQGNNPTNGVYINSIGEEHIFWDDGTDPAITLIPNYLISGIAAIFMSVLIIIWSIGFLGKKNGRIIFLILFIFLTLVGGGLGFIAFYLPTWAYSTRMYKPLTWWKKVLSNKLRKVLSKIWVFTLVFSCLFFIIGNLISIFGYFPGVTDPVTIFNICWAFLFASLLLLNITFISGFAYDIEKGNTEIQ